MSEQHAQFHKPIDYSLVFAALAYKIGELKSAGTVDDQEILIDELCRIIENACNFPIEGKTQHN
jgi:hypothetical protein